MNTEQAITPNAWNDTDVSDAEAILRRTDELLGSEVALASSFSIEDVMLMHLVHTIGAKTVIFALDTGRLNPETYACAEAMRKKYGIEIEWYFPKGGLVEDLVRKKGMFSFRESILNRKECCWIRKVEPLERALANRKGWITGLRREQSQTRTELDIVEMDEAHGGILKINPLSHYSTEQVWDYIKKYEIPYNRLHDQGYPSIGCAPCTRPIQPGEDIRAGRWWWEDPEHKECGLHVDSDSGSSAGLGI